MTGNKIVILGAGHVGSHCAYALAQSGISREIVLVDLLPEKAAAQALDIADSVSFLSREVTVRSGSYEECADADLVIVAIGEPRRPGQTRLDLLGRSVELVQVLAGQLAPVRLACPVVTITNPADIVAYCLRSWLSLPRRQCFSTGTLLDTARLRRILAAQAGVDRASVSALVMGEHGDSSMIPFSAITVGGLPFSRLGLDGQALVEQTRQAGMVIIEGKGSTEFGIGRATAELAACILRDEGRVLPLSVLLEGEYGQQNVHCGVPCVVGREGIRNIVSLSLLPQEQQALDASCQVIRRHIDLAMTQAGA